jgi:hypothetical protein
LPFDLSIVKRRSQEHRTMTKPVSMKYSIPYEETLQLDISESMKCDQKEGSCSSIKMHSQI